MTTENDWHWLAGIFEGEGTASMGPCYSGNGKRCLDRIVMTVPQKTRGMLEEVRRITGVGSIHWQESWQGWHWVCASRSARETLRKLLPFLRTEAKRHQVTIALEKDADNRKITAAKERSRNNLRRNGLGRFMSREEMAKCPDSLKTN